MKCIICSSLFQDYLDNTLSQDIMDELDHHFRICEKCCTCFKTYSLTIRLSRSIEQPCCPRPETIEKMRTLLIQRFLGR
ncbi:MAG TPA: zf-HC2 domain-containing protein [Deltaproteobacteria bacterium]|nr:zf-HC2 domain-containing protein [Deltaproteobacteria bacterium]HQI81341.1 zf-HC2 domain-containing protein [Deltaproteobacteria bacterium]